MNASIDAENGPNANRLLSILDGLDTAAVMVGTIASLTAAIQFHEVCMIALIGQAMADG